jgi:trimethylamine---corrinoid protein Co-methyltransferase
MGKPILRILEDDEIDAIHAATLRILGETGIYLELPAARKLLLGAGARLKDGHVVLPEALVEWALGQCPHLLKLRGRTGTEIILGDDSLHWHNLGGARDVYEPQCQTLRPAMVKDVVQAARLLDALPACTCVTPFFTPQDVEAGLMSLAMYRYTLPHTTKPVYGPGVQTATEVRFALHMAEVIGPPAEMLMIAISPISPLTFPDHLIEAMLETAHAGMSFGPLPCPTAGATAPITIAGALAQQNAEVLASIVLVQLANPGLPVMYCGRLAMMEPRTGASVWGGVELGLASAGTVQLAHHYGLPVNVYGFSTNSHTLDLQNGYERAMNALIPALAGADELSGIGEMAAGSAASYAQMVVDGEIADSVQRARRGFTSGSEALAVQVIAEVMETSHNFLSEEHTRQHLRAGEIFITKLAERGPWSDWEQRGRGSMAGRAQAAAERLLKEHQVQPLEPAQEKALDEILQAASAEMKGRG